jgi:defect-in-organelle-trafficking protein DotD
MPLSPKSFALLAGFLLLVGCTDSDDPLTTKPVAAEPDIVTIKLAQAADKASEALDSIASIEQVKNPAPPPPDYSSAPPDLMQPITIRWSGPIEPITRTLAQRAGLKFRVKGPTPGAPLTVSIDAYEQPILHVLRDIGLQAGKRADLTVDAATGVVEVVYAPVDRSE